MKTTFENLLIGDCFYFIDLSGNRLNGPHVRVGQMHYCPCRALAEPEVQAVRVLNGHQAAKVELVPTYPCI